MLDSDKWYVIDLDTNRVDTEENFVCFFDAIHWGNKKGYVNHTAMRGRVILADKRWIVDAEE